jgi:chromosomal replication initiation ATPase DnaA
MTAIVAIPRHNGEKPAHASPVTDRVIQGSERNIALCDRMIDIAGAVYCVPTRELRATARSTQEIARIRQIAMYVSHVVLGMSMTDVGKGYGRDRTTVLHACHLVEDLRDDCDFDALVQRLETVARAAFTGLDHACGAGL